MSPIDYIDPFIHFMLKKVGHFLHFSRTNTIFPYGRRFMTTHKNMNNNNYILSEIVLLQIWLVAHPNSFFINCIITEIIRFVASLIRFTYNGQLCVCINRLIQM